MNPMKTAPEGEEILAWHHTQNWHPIYIKGDMCTMRWHNQYVQYKFAFEGWIAMPSIESEKI